MALPLPLASELSRVLAAFLFLGGKENFGVENAVFYLYLLFSL